MAFLECKMWEIRKFPRYGTSFDLYAINGVIDYDSHDKNFYGDSADIQIPDFLIVGSQEEKEFVYKYIDVIVARSIPVVRNIINNGVESWCLDTQKASYLKYLKVFNKEKLKDG